MLVEAHTPDAPPRDDGPSIPLVVAPFAAATVALSFGAYPFGGEALLAAFVSTVLVTLAVIDLDRRIIPNRIVLPATAIVLVWRVALSPGHAAQYFIAAALAAAGMFLPRLISSNSIGMGDVKLALLMGAALGWNVGWAIVIAFLLMFPVALAIVVRGGAKARHSTLPMAPFLVAGSLIMLLVPGLTGG